MSLHSATVLAAEIHALAQSILRAAKLYLVWDWEMKRARAGGAMIEVGALGAARKAAAGIVDVSAVEAFEREGLRVVDANTYSVMLPFDWIPIPGRPMPRLGAMEEPDA